MRHVGSASQLHGDGGWFLFNKFQIPPLNETCIKNGNNRCVPPHFIRSTFHRLNEIGWQQHLRWVNLKCAHYRHQAKLNERSAKKNHLNRNDIECWPQSYIKSSYLLCAFVRVCTRARVCMWGVILSQFFLGYDVVCRSMVKTSPQPPKKQSKLKHVIAIMSKPTIKGHSRLFYS